MERVAEGVYRLGSRWVNWYLVEHEGQLTLIDASFSPVTGIPGAASSLGKERSTAVSTAAGLDEPAIAEDTAAMTGGRWGARRAGGAVDSCWEDDR